MRPLQTTIAAICFLLNFSALKAEDFILSLDNEDDSYFVTLLGAALKAADGNHRLRTHTYKPALPQSRIIRAMLDGTTRVNVIFTGHSKYREALLVQIDIPLLRGLLGYRVFAIKAKNTPLLSSLTSLDDLIENVPIGSATSWPDTVILRHAGFDIKTSTIDTLWHMLDRDRFMALPLSINEIQAKLARFKRTTPTSTILTEKTLMLYYPFGSFFYVTPDDSHRATIIEQGLKRLYETGEFLKIFYDDPDIKKALDEQQFYKRQIIPLENPLLSDRVKAIPAQYWHTFENQQPATSNQQQRIVGN